MPKALRCRLRFQAWEDRENQETRDRYQVCVRCNVYRDRGSAAPAPGRLELLAWASGNSATIPDRLGRARADGASVQPVSRCGKVSA